MWGKSSDSWGPREWLQHRSHRIPEGKTEN